VSVAGSVDVRGIEERFGIVEPLGDGRILLIVELELDSLERLDIKDVVSVIERRLLVVEGRETQTLEVTTISLLSSHGDPHGSPLSVVLEKGSKKRCEIRFQLRGIGKGGR